MAVTVVDVLAIRHFAACLICLNMLRIASQVPIATLHLTLLPTPLLITTPMLLKLILDLMNIPIRPITTLTQLNILITLTTVTVARTLHLTQTWTLMEQDHYRFEGYMDS